jgi:hypothetical protein
VSTNIYGSEGHDLLSIADGCGNGDLVITLLAYGCPLKAIVAAFGFHEKTVKN